MAAIESRMRAPATVAQVVPLIASVCLLGAAVVVGRGVVVAAMLTIAIAALVAFNQALSRWHTLIGLVVLIILFVPIKRYKLAAGLPFDLEPYRIVLAMVIVLWVAAALTDPRVRLRSSFLDGPLFLFLFAIIGSILTNISRIGDTRTFVIAGEYYVRPPLSADVLKKLIFLASFYLLFYFVISVVRDEQAIHKVVKTIVAGATAVAFFGVVEARTGYNVFDHLRSVFPFLNFEGALSEGSIARGGRLRVYASAQHPIALATAFVMVLPLALYLLWHTARKRWALASIVIGLGAISTVSRTSITVLVASALVFAWLRPREIKRLLPFLLPILVAVHIALPGAIGGIRESFFPSEGLVADQTVFGGRVSQQRLKPEFDRIAENPAFGQGYGTRITDAGSGLRKNANILDDEWLATTSETGLVGFAAWVWFFGRFIRRAGRESKVDRSARGWLLVALAASVASFAVGMLTYDAFSFIQVTFILFTVAAIGVCTLAAPGPWPSGRSSVVSATARFRPSAHETP